MSGLRGPEMVEMGRRLWGEPSKAHSTKTDVRFGTNGSKSIDRDTGAWFDHEAGQGGGYADLYEKLHGKRPETDSGIVAEYDYHDATGRLLFQVVRKVPKTFRQRKPDGNGGWIWKLEGVERVPYRLPELLRAAPGTTVYITEGEKDADALRERMLIATCNPGGAQEHKEGKPYSGKWLPSYSHHLRGRPVVILPDNDKTGEDHAQDIARKLAGIAASVRIVRLPGLPPKGDVSDWLAAGGAAEELERLATETPEQAPKDEPKPETAADLRAFLSIEAWAERDIPPPDRLLGDLVTSTTRAFLVGRTGLGKTMLGIALAVGISSGTGFLHWRSHRAGRVLYLDGEMPSELIRQRSIDALRRAEMPPVSGNLVIYARDGEEDFAKRFPDLGRLPPLNTEAAATWLFTLIDALGGVDVVIFDNVMSLIAGDQKDEVPWSDTLSLVTALTARRIGQVWLDHTGHNTDRQYGSSTKAWRFDSVGVMTALPDDKRQRGDMGFTLSFEHPGKARRRTPDNWGDFETTTIRLVDDHWTSQPGSRAGDAGGKVSPSRRPFYDALITAITTSPSAKGTTSLPEWQAACQRRGLIEAAAPEETAAQRGSRFRDFRRAKAELITAKWIAVDDAAVTDLRGKWA